MRTYKRGLSRLVLLAALAPLAMAAIAGPAQADDHRRGPAIRRRVDRGYHARGYNRGYFYAPPPPVYYGPPEPPPSPGISLFFPIR